MVVNLAGMRRQVSTMDSPGITDIALVVTLLGKREDFFIAAACGWIVPLARLHPRQHEERLGHASLVAQLAEEAQGLLRQHVCCGQVTLTQQRDLGRA